MIQTICSKVIDVIRTSNRLAVENYQDLLKIPSCEKKINDLSEKILKRIYQLKSTVQTGDWNQFDIDEKLEQLIEINDQLFERIVSKENEK